MESQIIQSEPARQSGIEPGLKGLPTYQEALDYVLSHFPAAHADIVKEHFDDALMTAWGGMLLAEGRPGVLEIRALERGCRETGTAQSLGRQAAKRR